MKRVLPKLDPYSTPLWLLILSYSFLYVRWQDIIPGIGATRITGLLTYGLLVWYLIKGDRTIMWREPLLRYSLIFVGLMAMSVLWAVHVSAFFTTEYVVLIVLSFEVPLVFLLRDWDRAVRFFRYWVLIQFLVALWALRTRGVGGGDFLADENDLSLAMSMALPYAIYVKSMTNCPTRWRVICNLTIITIVLVIMVSFSRGGFVGMVCTFGTMWWYSKRRGRNLAIALAVMVFLGFAIVKLIPDSYKARLDSMFDPENSTRVERLRSWEIARLMWKDNPIVGVGAAQFPWNVARYETKTSYWIDYTYTKSLSGRQVHSLYFQLLADMGIVGCTVWVILVLGIVRAMFAVIRTSNKLARGPPPASRMKSPTMKGGRPLKNPLPPPPEPVDPKERERIDDSALLARAVLASLAGFLVSGAFISVAYYPHLWLMAGFATVIKMQGALRGSAAEPAEPAKTDKRAVRRWSAARPPGLGLKGPT